MKIYIDVGHGKTGEDSGASATSANVIYYENGRNLKIAAAVCEALKQAGHDVTMSRTANVNLGELVGSYNRADSNLINSAKAVTSDFDFMISIHCNDSENTSAKGIWICGKPDTFSQQLVERVKNGFLNNYKKHQHAFVINQISTTYKNYGILRLHNQPGVLIECGFMSNAKDLHEILCNAAGIGSCIADSIIAQIGTVDKNADISAELDKIEASLEIIRAKLNNG